MKAKHKGLTRILAMLLSLLLIIGMTGCDKGGSDADSGEDEKTETPSSEVSAPLEESTETQQGGEETKIKTSEQLYKDFLAGKAKVYCDLREYFFYDSVADEEYKLYDDPNGYTLKELVSNVQDVLGLIPDSEVRVCSVSYANLDCKNDGEPELVLEIQNTGDTWGDGSVYQFILKNVDGKLQIIDRLESGYRSDNYVVNSYGLICASWYWGMGNEATYYYLDAAGEEKFLYSVGYIYAMSDYGGEGSLYDVAAKIAEREGNEYLFDCLDFVEYRFKPYEDDENTNEVIKYSYEYYGGAEQEKIPADLYALVQEIFTTAGVTLYEQDEIDKMMKDRFKECGLSDKEVSVDDENFVWTNLSAEEYWPGKISTVSTTAEFMAAIEDNAIIYLEPGTYNLSQWLKSDNNLSKVPEHYTGDYSGENQPGVTYSGYDEYSYEITVYGIRNLQIESKDPQNPAKIVTGCPWADVLSFDQCAFVNLRNLIMGHEIEPGLCDGNVLGFVNCRYYSVTECDLYGCGAYGFGLEGGYGGEIYDCVIHDCTYGCMQAYDAGYVYVSGTKFEHCKEFTMFSCTGGSFNFSNCSFRDLQGKMLYVAEDSYMSFSDCQFDVASLDSIKANEAYDDRIYIY